MSIAPHSTARSESLARIRPATAAATFGAVVGLAIGCAYLGGAAAKATTVRAHAERLDAAAAAGFTEEALSAAAGGMDESALTIARRHDPYTMAGPSQRDRQAELLTGRLEALRATPSTRLRHVSLNPGEAARPFRFDSALDASRDLECLTQAVYYEARGEGRDGMRAVAQVVLNRSRHASFPKTICGVVFQGANRRTGCQFSFTCDGSIRGRVNQAAWNRARDIASAALGGAVYSPVGNATHFHTTGVAPVWRTSMVPVTRVGDHLFYRFGGRSGSGRAFAYQPEPSTIGAEGADVIQASFSSESGQPVPYTALVAREQGPADTPVAPARPATPSAPATQPAAAQPGPAQPVSDRTAASATQPAA